MALVLQTIEVDDYCTSMYIIIIVSFSSGCNLRSDWLILGHFSPTGLQRKQSQANKAKRAIINNLSTSQALTIN